MARMSMPKYDGENISEKLQLLNPRVIRPTEIRGGDNFGYKIIARVWEAWNGWCAYQGPTEWTDEQVAFYGDEVDYEIAKRLFPSLDFGRSYGGT